ncbi:Endosomal targeting BRO1-like domain-containing protein [Klebsormidium nitens]|uniref:Endosomal targeting BRO1-like domain-containing protein n=1 Tax=Klebsormidium nitens TaxID=105231 RepID=A0A1Y1HLN6_KLENI|nr:Endosomal targeting BRO1-like domain-containing protein [Klebsormidium nitens]|eukprot:GAQ78079.1 Endosomal targeting BRO1-like domain-containing protein [Klebsormidium nitens]
MGCAAGKTSAVDDKEPGPQVFSPGLRHPSSDANFRVELSGKASDPLVETLSTLRTRVGATLNGATKPPSGPSLQPVLEEYIPVLLGLTKLESLDTAVNLGWTNHLARDSATELRSAKYELVSILQVMAVAFVEDAGRALQTQGDKEVGLAEMKAAFAALLKAAGILQQSIGSVLPNEMDVHARTNLPADVTPGALKALFRQCLAQAAELQLQLDRSKEDVPPATRRDVACEAVVHWGEARESMATVSTGGPLFEKWLAYVKWRQTLAKAVAYHQEGLILDEKEDKGTHGKAVKALKTAEELLKESEAFLKEFSEKQPATMPVTASPLIKDLRERLPKDSGKIGRFNTNVYYEKEPDDPPELPKPSFTIKPEPYTLPEIDRAWGSSSSGDSGGSHAVRPPITETEVPLSVSGQGEMSKPSSKVEAAPEVRVETKTEAVAAS